MIEDIVFRYGCTVYRKRYIELPIAYFQMAILRIFFPEHSISIAKYKVFKQFYCFCLINFEYMKGKQNPSLHISTLTLFCATEPLFTYMNTDFVLCFV